MAGKQVALQMEKNGEHLKTFLTKFNNVINMKHFVLFVLAISFLTSFAFAAPAASSCGGSVLTAGQSTSQGEYSVKLFDVHSGNMASFQVFKNGQNPWFLTASSGRTVTSTNYPDVTVQVCGASNSDSPRWADVKVTVNVPTAPAPTPAPAPAPSPAPEPAAEPAPTSEPTPAPSPAPACSAPSLSGSGYSSNGYTVRLSLFTGHEGDSVRHPVLQVLKNGNPVTFLTIWNVGVAQTVSGLQPLNGDSLQINVCEANAASNVVKGTVSVSLATPTPTPVPVPVPTSTCGGSVLNVGQSTSQGEYSVKVAGVYSGNMAVLQIFKNGESLTLLPGTYPGQTRTYTSGQNTISAQVCAASNTDNPKWADVKVTVNVPTAPAPSPAPAPQPQPAPEPNQTVTPPASQPTNPLGNTVSADGTLPILPTLELPPMPEPEQTYTLNMHRGWSLFSVPFGLNVNSVTTTCAFYPSNIFAYLPAALNVSASYSHPSSLEVGKGYWFRTYNACTVTLSGEPADEFQLNLNAGWNTISVPRAVSLSSLESDCNVVKGPYAYDNSARKWSKTESLKPLKGYFVKVDSTCTLSNE